MDLKGGKNATLNDLQTSKSRRSTANPEEMETMGKFIDEVDHVHPVLIHNHFDQTRVYYTVIMKFILIGLFIFQSIAFSSTSRRVEDNVLISDSLPQIKIKVDPAIHYLGSFPFEIKGVAAGKRYVFAESDGKNIKRVVIAQFESFLPENSEIYRYSFANAIDISGHKFNHSTNVFTNAEAAKENPEGEAALTVSFLKKKGFEIPEAWLVSRFLTLGDESRKHELILFYQEDLKSSGHKFEELSVDDESTEVLKSIGPALKERALKAMQIQ